MREEGAQIIERKRFALNRIACPSLGLQDFFRFAADVGISKVELRNDLPGGQVTDGMAPAEAAETARRIGITVIAINALQGFNLGSLRAAKVSEMDSLVELADALGCAAVVMCPVNDRSDRRDPATRMEETVSALKAFGPALERRRIRGLVEPLGFAESSLSSVTSAAQAIARSGFQCYRILYDTFHHFLGPDREGDLDATFAVSGAGLIHVSGVESTLAPQGWRDEHRVLPSPADRSDSRKQVAHLVSQGYRGDISLEPFSPQVQRLSRGDLAAALRRSVEYMS